MPEPGVHLFLPKKYFESEVISVIWLADHDDGVFCASLADPPERTGLFVFPGPTRRISGFLIVDTGLGQALGFDVRWSRSACKQKDRGQKAWQRAHRQFS